MMFDFAINAGSKQKERKKERQPQSEKWLMEIIRMVRINLPLKICWEYWQYVKVAFVVHNHWNKLYKIQEVNNDFSNLRGKWKLV